jgi:hypothetical protein
MAPFRAISRFSTPPLKLPAVAGAKECYLVCV